MNGCGHGSSEVTLSKAWLKDVMTILAKEGFGVMSFMPTPANQLSLMKSQRNCWRKSKRRRSQNEIHRQSGFLGCQGRQRTHRNLQYQ